MACPPGRLFRSPCPTKMVFCSVQNQEEGFPTAVSSCLDLLKQQHDEDENSYVSAIRYSYYLPLDTLPNRRVPLFTIAAIAKHIWDRCLARAKNGPFGGASQDPPIVGSSPTPRLPQEVVDMIVAYLTGDTHSLLTCSLTSRFWYIAAVPHLHRILVTRVASYNRHENTKWPNPLRMASQFGFLPFVAKLSIHAEGY